LTFSTILSNDLVVLIAYSELNTGASPTVSSVSGASLTWNLRVRSNASTHGNLEVWWAIAATPLTGATITASYTGNFDDATLCVFAINGVNTSTPWDANASLPAKQSYTATATPSFSSISTNSTNALALFAVGTANNWATPGTVPTGYAALATANNAGGSLFAAFAVANQVQAATMAGVTVAWGSSIIGTNAGLEAVFDAIALTSPLLSLVEVTQIAVEEWQAPNPIAQVTQLSAEEWLTTNPAAQVTQIALEEWTPVPPPPLWVTQVAIEHWSAGSAAVQIAVTQAALEHWTATTLAVVPAIGPMITTIF
jgi:hypothetical protein